MQLKIHLISHPIIQSLSSTVRSQRAATPIRNQALRQLGLLMIYETVRNWLTIYRLTIQQKKNRKEITLIDPKSSCVIIFNNLKDLNFLCDIQQLVPRNNLNLIRENEINNTKSHVAAKLSKINSYTKIIITSDQLDSKYTSNLLGHLVKYHQVKLTQIRLTCITCTTDQLINLKQKYNNLNIYTTQIVQN